MHDVLRQRLLRKIESLPDEQVYQVLDYIEFLESKYVTAEGVSTSGLQKFAEGLEDKLRRRAVSPNTIREAFQLISAADRVLSGVSSAGRQILDDLGQALEPGDEGVQTATGADDARRIEADPRKRRTSGGRSTSKDPASPPSSGPSADSPDQPSGSRPPRETGSSGGGRRSTPGPSGSMDGEAVEEEDGGGTPAP